LASNTKINQFIQQFESQPVWHIRAPGRINLIGEHIDYYGGYVMPAAINRYTDLIIGKSQGPSCIFSQLFNERYSLAKPDASPPTWAKYFNYALQILKESGYQTIPFNLWVDSNIPLGAGLSSSAALLCGFVSCLNQLNQWSLPTQKIAYLAQTIEHRLGTPCGLMDQYACLYGKKNAFLLLDCNSLSFQYIHVDMQEYEWVLINTRVFHQLNEGGYARRRREGEHALESLKSFYSKSGSYRDFNLDELDEIPVLTDVEMKRARHAISEHKRIRLFSESVLSNDWLTAGSYMYDTHYSLKDDYEVSCPEADFIVSKARENKVAGARIMGGGFGGCVLCLIDKNLTDSFVSRLVPEYTSAFNQAPAVIQVELGEFSIDLL